MSFAFIFKLLTEVVPLVVAGVSGALDVLNRGVDTVKRMKAEERDPTSEEWKELNSFISANLATLNSDDDERQQFGEYRTDTPPGGEPVGIGSLGEPDEDSVEEPQEPGDPNERRPV